MSDRWVRIAAVDDFPRREGRAVSVGGRELAIFNLGASTAPGAGDRFVAVENRCPHQGGPLADGIVSGCTVVCPLHAWKVRLDTGAVDRPSAADACVHTFSTRVEDGIVMVQLPPIAERAA